MRIHYCAGDIYLDGYINIDVVGQLAEMSSQEQIDANKTTLDNYFKYPFIEDAELRHKSKRPFIVDRLENILERWNFDDSSAEEIVMISSLEHFWPQEIKNHIIPEICRVLKPGGKLIIDFPDIVKTVEEYKDKNPEHMITLLYCNHTSQYAIHHYGYTEETFKNLFPASYEVNRKDIVKHDYPTTGMEVTKR